MGGGLASLSILIDTAYGWRQTLAIAGITGAAISLISFLLLPEPRNKSSLKSSSTADTSVVNPITSIQTVIQSLKEVLIIPEVQSLLFASLLRFAAGFTIAVWKAPFVFEKFPGSEQLFSSSNALIITAGGLTSSVLGGIIADRISSSSPDSTNPPRSKIWVPAVGSLLAIPAWTSFILANDPVVAALSLFIEYIVAECWIGPTLASLYNVVPSNRRGTTQGTFSLLIAFGNIAPYIVGLFTGGALASFSIGQSILWLVNFAYLVSGLSFVSAAVKDDVKVQAEWMASKQL